MNKIQKFSLIGSVIFALMVLVGATLYVGSQEKPAVQVSQPVPQRTVTIVEVKASDGKDGRDCLVAVDGTVYKIDDFTLWQNGEHKSSKGMAYCGADLSEVIGKSPHGRKKLDVLIKVGPLAS